MALLKKFIPKNIYMLAVTVWNGLASYIPLHFHFAPETVALILVVGNAVITYLSTESDQT